MRAIPLALVVLGLACAPREQGRPPLPESVELNCVPGTGAPPTGVLGISDPNSMDPGVIAIVDDSGASWVRMELHWSIIQPDPEGPMDFSAHDAEVDAYLARGIDVLPILTYIPAAFGDDFEAIEPAFRAFATEAVRRYAPRGVHVWEVFNEPNLPGYGWLTAEDDAYVNLPHYTRLLGIANEVVRAEDPEGLILVGGIASEQHRGLAIEETLEILYGYGAKDCFDIMGFHPYGYQNQFAEARARVQAVLDEAGDSDKPVWFSEYGFADQHAMDLNVNDTVDTNPMMAVFDQKEVADAFFWFAAKDYSASIGTPTFGLADFDLNRRPSFFTFQSLAAAE